MTLSLRAGTDYKLEAEADEILAKWRATLTTAEEKKELLTPATEKLRLEREVYNDFGVADAHLFSGQYNRDYNPEFGQRPSRSRRTED